MVVASVSNDGDDVEIGGAKADAPPSHLLGPRHAHSVLISGAQRERKREKKKEKKRERERLNVIFFYFLNVHLGERERESQRERERVNFLFFSRGLNQVPVRTAVIA